MPSRLEDVLKVSKQELQLLSCLRLAHFNAPRARGGINELRDARVQTGPLSEDFAEVVLSNHRASGQHVQRRCHNCHNCALGLCANQKTHGHLHKIAQSLLVILHFEQNLAITNMKPMKHAKLFDSFRLHKAKHKSNTTSSFL